MDGRKTQGLRIFLITLLNMAAKGIEEDSTDIENNIKNGIAPIITGYTCLSVLR